MHVNQQLTFLSDIAATKYNPQNLTHAQSNLQAQAQAHQLQLQLQQSQATLPNQLMNTIPAPLSTISSMSSMSTLSPVGAMHDSFVLSHSNSNSGSPVPTIGSTSSEPTMHSNYEQMHPQNWIGPTSVPWNSLGSAVGGYIYDSRS